MKQSKKFSIILLLILIISLLTSYSAFAYVYEGKKWPINNTLYKYNSNLPAGWQSSVYSAAGTWNGKSKFSLYYSTSANNVYGAANYGGYSGELGVTYVYSSGTKIVGANSDFNTYESWSTNPNSSQYDLQSNALHEFGHWLQLMDLYNNTSPVMYGYLDAGVTKRSLTTDDVNGIRYIYGQ